MVFAKLSLFTNKFLVYVYKKPAFLGLFLMVGILAQIDYL